MFDWTFQRSHWKDPELAGRRTWFVHHFVLHTHCKFASSSKALCNGVEFILLMFAVKEMTTLTALT